VITPLRARYAASDAGMHSALLPQIALHTIKRSNRSTVGLPVFEAIHCTSLCQFSGQHIVSVLDNLHCCTSYEPVSIFKAIHCQFACQPSGQTYRE